MIDEELIIPVLAIIFLMTQINDFIDFFIFIKRNVMKVKEHFLPSFRLKKEIEGCLVSFSSSELQNFENENLKILKAKKLIKQTSGGYGVLTIEGYQYLLKRKKYPLKKYLKHSLNYFLEKNGQKGFFYIGGDLSELDILFEKKKFNKKWLNKLKQIYYQLKILNDRSLGINQDIVNKYRINDFDIDKYINDLINTQFIEIKI